MRRVAVTTAAICLLMTALLSADTPQAADKKVGDQVDGATLTRSGELLHPAGDSVATHGKPFDVVAAPDGSLLFVKSGPGLDVIDPATMTSRQRLVFTKEQKLGGSMHGLVVVPGNDKFQWIAYFTATGKELLEIGIPASGDPVIGRKIALPGDYNFGVAVSADHKLAYVCMSAENTLGVVDLTEGKLTGSVAVGVTPYDVVLSPDGKTAFVTNYGGPQPKKGQPTEKSYGTDVVVDQRSIPTGGSVSVVDLASAKETSQIDVGLHPTQIIVNKAGTRLFVANANSDSVSVIDTAKRRVSETIPVRPDPVLPFGSIPDALALSDDQKTLYIANAGNNALAVVSVESAGDQKSAVRGYIPTGWFPGGVTAAGEHVFVANTRSATITRISPPDTDALAKWTAQVVADDQVPQILLENQRAKSTVPPLPVPARPADPSLFHHVVYILKENKTYDQVLGDIGRGNSDPKLCVYGKKVTPNHHALADQFVLLDNYYCNGVNSSDGHQWATQGVVSEYFEKGSRTYDFGTDALCYASSDFIWDSCLLHGLSVRNYGEFDFPASTPKSLNWFDIYKGWDKSGQTMFRQSLQFQNLSNYTCKQYPGWNLDFPDVCRTRVFLKEFGQFEKAGKMPNFLLVYLPQDHTSGTGQSVPTPRAMVADNDLATGQVVEAISKSQFWKDTVIFINEDDPQSGYDHVDGHRSFCLIASPYTKRNAIVSRFYNQTSVLHTMTRILGLPPLNQQCGLSPTMEDCFTTTPDFRSYTAIPNTIPLDERNKKRDAMVPDEQRLHDAVAKMDFTRPDRIDTDTFNRLGWIESGRTEPYPADFAGPHGRGLAALHLRLDASADADDDDDQK
jgi:YVTN family beta-propeller protein